MLFGYWALSSIPFIAGVAIWRRKKAEYGRCGDLIFLIDGFFAMAVGSTISAAACGFIVGMTVCG